MHVQVKPKKITMCFKNQYYKLHTTILNKRGDNKKTQNKQKASFLGDYLRYPQVIHTVILLSTFLIFCIVCYDAKHTKSVKKR